MSAAIRLCLRIAYAALLVWWRIRRPAGQGAYVFVWVDDQLLVIRQSYRAGLNVPAGGMKRGETPIRAAARELREETGIVVDPSDLEPAGRILSHLEYKDDEIHFFELHLADRPSLSIDHREVIAAEFVPRSELAALDLWPPIRHFLEKGGDGATLERTGLAGRG